MQTDEQYNEDLAADGTLSGVESDEGAKGEQEPFDPEKISIDPKVIPMDVVIRRLLQGSIRLAPAFQRKDIWDDERKSQFIESLMLNIPVPMFYLAADEKANWDVVDGLQRLTTIKEFVLGNEYFETRDEKIKGKGLKLKGLEFWGDKFNGSTFSELNELSEPTMVNRILETQFQFTIINPGTPEEVKRNIFKRINTGGMPLTSQEIRHALYQGKSSELLAELVTLAEYKTATASSVKDSRMAGRELILRFLSFSIREYTEYPKKSDMDAFLSDTMRIINLMPDLPQKELSKIFHNSDTPIPKLKITTIEELKNRFSKAMNRAHHLFGVHTFRKSYGNNNRAPINKTLFEVWGNLLAELSDDQFKTLLYNSKDFLNEYNKMLATHETANMISKHSSKYSGVKDRYEKFSTILKKYV
ncbi:MAG: DUF262 domain-containing protein [Desulfamplus sp.]|nr:DUF262 domain-containing protein [Desulfamplus sp.]